MSTSKRKHYEGTLLEEINSKIDRLAEILVGVVNTQQIHTEKLSTLETDMTIVKSVAVKHSAEISDLRSTLSAPAS